MGVDMIDTPQYQDRETELERNVSLQNSHLNQAFDYLEKKFKIELDKDDRDAIKVVIVKTILHKSSMDELNEFLLEQSIKKSKNQEVWDRLSGEETSKEKSMTEQVIEELEKN